MKEMKGKGNEMEQRGEEGTKGMKGNEMGQRGMKKKKGIKGSVKQ
jgi:hypothetical protein